MIWFRGGLTLAEGSKRWSWCLMITIAYVATGRLALLLAVPPGYATAIFPPAGIAMAAVLIAGWNVLPWILVASLVLNIWAGTSVAALSTSSVVAVATVIAAASVAQAALGAWSLRRFVGYPLTLDNGSDLGRFLLIPPALEAKKLGYPGDERGLYLQISSNRATSWVFRFRDGQKLRE